MRRPGAFQAAKKPPVSKPLQLHALLTVRQQPDLAPPVPLVSLWLRDGRPDPRLHDVHAPVVPTRVQHHLDARGAERAVDGLGRPGLYVEVLVERPGGGLEVDPSRGAGPQAYDQDVHPTRRWAKHGAGAEPLDRHCCRQSASYGRREEACGCDTRG